MSATSIAATFSSLSQKFWQDLQPTPGRLNSSLRIVLATIIALILILVWQMPFVSVGLYFIFLIGRDSPALSLKSSLISITTVVLAIAAELAVIICTDNDPMARLLSVTVVTFIAGMLVASTNFPTLGSTWGLIYCTVIAFWESHARADTLVKNSLWLIGTFSVAVGCAVAVEYILGDRNPAERLEEQRRIRYQALDKLFTSYAQGATPEQKMAAAIPVSRLAIAGSTGMMELYNTIVERNLDTGTLPIGTRVRITMQAQIMDVAAAFGLQNVNEDSPELRQRCARIAEQCRELIPNFIPKSEKRLLKMDQVSVSSLLDRVEGAIHAIMTMPTEIGTTRDKEMVALPTKKVQFFIPGAIYKKDTVAFALKISLCATLCYIVYNAVAWPGISTAVITVIVTGLSSSGAIKQRLLFRLLGSIIGGLIFGLGAISFLFPHMDSITSLIVLVAPIALLSAWTAAGPRFNYVGLQIAFSFYIVAFEGFSAPTQLAPARDRLIGILLALVVMWFVFDQMWPVRTVTVMRRQLATVLNNEASLFRLMNSNEDHNELVQRADILRDQVGKTVATLRSMNDAVDYEFGVDRERHVRSGEMILRAAVTAGALFWNQFAVLHSEEDKDFLVEPALIQMRQRLADNIDAMAQAIIQKTDISITDIENLVGSGILESARYGEYSHNTVARFEELQSFTSMLRYEV
jgi:multidrug resistance protein MdtO